MSTSTQGAKGQSNWNLPNTLTWLRILMIPAILALFYLLPYPWADPAACAAFAAKPRTIPVVKPVVNSISGFIAVVPAERSAELERLAGDCVSAFDAFRAPLTPEDRARRNPSRLTPRQCDYLDRWGYPYVMEEFRFHMTLTGRLDDRRREPILAMLRDRFATIGLERLAIDAIALFRQNDTNSRFRILDHWKLRSSP